MAKNRYREQ